MAAATLRERLDRLPELARLGSARGGVVAGVPSGAVSLLAWWLRETTSRTILVVAAESERVYSDALVWDGGTGAAIFPAGDTPPFDRVPPSEEVTRARLATLMRLHARAEPLLVVASPRGLLRPTLSRGVVEAGLTEVRRGAHLPRDALLARLVELGYHRESAVSVPGDFAVRGGIVDVFGVDRARPWRAEWFGDDVEDLRAFDPATQELIAKLEIAQVWPARELDLSSESVARALESVGRLDSTALRDDVREQWDSDCALLASGVYEEGLDLFFPYLGDDPPSTLLDHLDNPIVLLDGGRERLIAAAERHAEEIEGLRLQEEARGELPHGASAGLVDVDTLFKALDGHASFELVREAPNGAVPAAELGWRGVDSYVGRFDAFVREAIHERDEQGCVLVVSRQQHRVEELASEHGADTVDASDFAAATTPLPAGAIVVASADLTQGFAVADGSVHVYTDAELFGAVKRRRSVLARGSRRAVSTSARGARRAASGTAAREAFVLQFAPGDLVVHRDHGISRFVEMRAVTDDGGAVHEYMLLEYAEGDRTLRSDAASRPR